MTRLLGLIGYPVEQSLSPAMHNAAFAACGLDYSYQLLPTPVQDLDARIRDCIEQGFAGWNITVPHKQAVLPYLDEVSDEVRATGACNTVRVTEGRLTGYNTDMAGFMQGLAEARGIEADSKAVLLGAGGAARAVAMSLACAGHPLVILSRRENMAREMAASLLLQPNGVTSGTLDRTTLEQHLDGASLLVNCTPVGMWPNTRATPLPEGTQLPSNLLVYDLIYKPRPTCLLEDARAVGCRTQDGLSMLVNQGAAAFRIWTGVEPPVEVMRRACDTWGVKREM